ncbi:MAG: hypothetical protein ACK48N_10420, partial [Planctomyces sp.]
MIGTHRNAALIRRRVRAAGCVCVASALSLVGVLATGCVSPAEPLGDLSSLTLGPGRADPDVLNGQYVATLHTRRREHVGGSTRRCGAYRSRQECTSRDRRDEANVLPHG